MGAEHKTCRTESYALCCICISPIRQVSLTPTPKCEAAVNGVNPIKRTARGVRPPWRRTET